MGGISPKVSSKNTDEIQYCIGFDGLKIAAKFKNGNTLQKSTFLFTQNGDTKPTKYFHELYIFDTIIDGKAEYFCSVEAKPRISSIPQDNVYVRIANKWLYSKQLNTLLNQFLEAFELSFHHITSIDVFCDFQQSQVNMNIQGFMAKAFFGGLQKSGSRNMNCFKDNKQIETFYWGRKSSGMQICMYNKSLELKVKDYKPHVYDNWINNNYDLSQDTYRLEFRLKQSDLRVQLKDNEIDFNNYQTAILDNAAKLFKMLHDKYFLFKKKPQGSTEKKVYRWNDWYFLKPINQDVNAYEYTKYVNTPSTGKKFCQYFYNELLTKDKPTQLTMYPMLQMFLQDRNLTTYFETVNGININDNIKLLNYAINKNTIEKDLPTSVLNRQKNSVALVQRRLLET